jgi:V-containing nitrogenase delta subunit
MTKKAEELVAFIQERCLWQFVSRANDREENINGVLTCMEEILKGESPKLETPMDRLHFANANRLAQEVKVAFPWLQELPGEEMKEVVSGTIARIYELTVKKSLNGELNIPGY